MTESLETDFSDLIDQVVAGRGWPDFLLDALARDPCEHPAIGSVDALDRLLVEQSCFTSVD